MMKNIRYLSFILVQLLVIQLAHAQFSDRQYIKKPGDILIPDTQYLGGHAKEIQFSQSHNTLAISFSSASTNLYSGAGIIQLFTKNCLFVTS